MSAAREPWPVYERLRHRRSRGDAYRVRGAGGGPHWIYAPLRRPRPSRERRSSGRSRGACRLGGHLGASPWAGGGSRAASRHGWLIPGRHCTEPPPSPQPESVSGRVPQRGLGPRGRAVSGKRNSAHYHLPDCSRGRDLTTGGIRTRGRCYEPVPKGWPILADLARSPARPAATSRADDTVRPLSAGLRTTYAGGPPPHARTFARRRAPRTTRPEPARTTPNRRAHVVLFRDAAPARSADLPRSPSGIL